ncbi:diguanylate cyclase (GGDEF)-like protein [Sphingomonas jejuensis]|uniref:Diguanylate cyclase (GGDEF)-like protein n=1 Tax=Sphingomonas jejuensis TaxID=904715 RepID=A0ABX0XKW0_9SPHN|nr:EAL domain-containing protein [Sphingomonas jejuensis]NJC33365.1 diguanylate cyclase (GGDEF)-like protein [Sphingomonas jejuensis]
MLNVEVETAPAKRSPFRNARVDLVTGGITIAAIIMFAGTGAPVVAKSVESLLGGGAGADRLLTTALILNIALVLFGWRRYADLQREVGERAAAEARANELASIDPLTGFLNRRSLADHGEQFVARAAQRGQGVALLMLDLDNFKTVNDLNGHAIGDAALVIAANVIKASVPAGTVCGRLGGDEFACMVAFDGQSELVDKVADAIVTNLSEPCDAGGVQLHLTASLGIARMEARSDTVDALMRRADIAMYVSKQRGRNRFSWFDPSMERELQTRNAIETGIREGIPAGQFVPFYEQQVDLATGRIHGFEMLARWNHPELGLVSPDMFIPIAEEAGMIGDLSLSIMRQAFAEARNWAPELTLSVNISPSQLKDPWLAQKIVKLLVETGFPPNRLEVEITESALFENLGLAQSIVGSLKNQGIRIALDDFGTGYSSLAHLRALPFDRIKIDRSFVSSINENQESAAIVNAITRLGDSLGLPITAEGIEDHVIEERMKDMGALKGQGWRFGKPMGVEQVRALLADQNLLPAARAPEPDEEPEATRRRAG